MPGGPLGLLGSMLDTIGRVIGYRCDGFFEITKGLILQDKNGNRFLIEIDENGEFIKSPITGVSDP